MKAQTRKQRLEKHLFRLSFYPGSGRKGWKEGDIFLKGKVSNADSNCFLSVKGLHCLSSWHAPPLQVCLTVLSRVFLPISILRYTRKHKHFATDGSQKFGLNLRLEGVLEGMQGRFIPRPRFSRAPISGNNSMGFEKSFRILNSFVRQFSRL